VLSGDVTNANFKFFSLTRSGIEPTIYCSRGEHANHYTTDAVGYIDIQRNGDDDVSVVQNNILN
jgi:hypothetical protein